MTPIEAFAIMDKDFGTVFDPSCLASPKSAQRRAEQQAAEAGAISTLDCKMISCICKLTDKRNAKGRLLAHMIRSDVASNVCFQELLRLIPTADMGGRIAVVGKGAGSGRVGFRIMLQRCDRSTPR